MPNVKETIFSILHEVLDLPKSEINRNAFLIEDLNFDSLDAVDFATAIEERFELKLQDSELMDFATVGSVIDAIERKLEHGC
ncbi:MAG: acyl carrier protein [Eubacteriales bacterium]|nr:acyl carrier protein [Eubacteriales bacterium]